MNIGIMGVGCVGKALRDYYAPNHTVFTFDKATDSYSTLQALNDNANEVFICVGTPYLGPGKGLDCSQVHAAVDSLTGSKTVIIKSTVMPGTTDAIQAMHNEHRVFFVPEFLNEDTAAEDYANPRRPHVIGTSDGLVLGDQADLPYLNDVIELLPGIECKEYSSPMMLPAKQAELLKLATNSFYALKVAFTNQMFDIGMTQGALDALGEDSWIYPYHLQVEHKGFRGFGGTCLPKDAAALCDYASSDAYVMHDYAGTDNDPPSVIKSAVDYNKELCAKQGIDISQWLYKQNSKIA